MKQATSPMELQKTAEIEDALDKYGGPPSPPATAPQAPL